MAKTLPKELTRLVDWAVTQLGKTIRDELGIQEFKRIEKIRSFVKSSRGQKVSGLMKLKEELAGLTEDQRFQVAHSFSLMLEIINSCEAAYRTYRLRAEAPAEDAMKVQHKYGRTVHVLTAHPTESRSSDVIYYFKKLQTLLEKHLENPSSVDLQKLEEILKWLWRLPMSKQRKPTVMDEAEYIYTLALQREILDLTISRIKEKQPFYLRTWVGGDKDGHPGVDEKTMLGSLQMARGFFLRYFQERVEKLLLDLKPLQHSASQSKKQISRFYTRIKDLKKDLRYLKTIKRGDAQRVHDLRAQLIFLTQTYREIFNVDSATLIDLRILIDTFPGLVVPLEIREESGLVHEALKQKKPLAIARMLKLLATITPKHDPRLYVKGFILSQTESADDIAAGMALVKKHLGIARLPVVPLFESAHSLQNSVSIISEFLKIPARRKLIKEYWSGNVEVMLGYSDSAKENGSWPSRYLISSALHELEKKISSYGLNPIFFHGSGGSVERGGGSIQEQTEWWPPSALTTVKVTVQGEMIYRNYSQPEILEKQLQRFAVARDEARYKAKENHKKLLAALAESVKTSYQNILKEPEFLDLIEKATPYSYLKNLKLGSRPAKRQGPVNLKGLRAIPWVLCWTQTRTLFPSWWGVGSYWRSLSSAEKTQYKKTFKQSALFRSYIKVLGFTLEKIELDIFEMYLRSSKLPDSRVQKFMRRFKEEYRYCQIAVKEISQQQSLLWYRPWLETSIRLRSPLIHPLNVLQLIALEEKNIPLLRETVTGIASGMMTTG
ncbi:phosphoenolpyruvate carboxylase [Bdellovibrio bacteriovorus]